VIELLLLLLLISSSSSASSLLVSAVPQGSPEFARWSGFATDAVLISRCGSTSESCVVVESMNQFSFVLACVEFALF